MAETRTRNRARTEAELVAAARALVEVQTYESIRVRDIADRVGCNHGLITQYFGTKRGLFTHVARELVAEISSTIAEGGSAPPKLDQPTTATFWRLTAALLDAGMDPSEIMVESISAVDAVAKRAGDLSGSSFNQARAVAGFVVLMSGGYHVFGDLVAATIAPSGDPAEAQANFERTVFALIRGLATP